MTEQSKIKKLSTGVKNLPIMAAIPTKYRRYVRDKAIERARTRIVVAGGDPATFKQDDLEIIVREEEDKIKSAIKERGLLAILALLGISVFG